MHLTTEQRLTLAALLDSAEFCDVINEVCQQESQEWRDRAFSNTFSKILDNEKRMNVIIEQSAKAAAFDNVLLVLRGALKATNRAAEESQQEVENVT